MGRSPEARNGMTFLELAQSFDRIEATSGRLEMTEILAGLFRATTCRSRPGGRLRAFMGLK